MAIFKLLHEGTSIKGLKTTIRYNTKEKNGVNTPENKRLIGVSSNCGFCDDVENEVDLNNLKQNFVNTVEANKNLAKNSRQTNVYEHLAISFSEEDDQNYSQDELQEIALEACREYDQNFDNTPFLLFPQKDSGKLHFHLVRGFNDEDGGYHRQSQSKKKMTAAAQKIEKKHNLTYTGKNDPNNWFMIDGKRTYAPQKAQENGIFEKKYRLDETNASTQESFINKINTAYRKEQTSKEFIQELNRQGIEIKHTQRKNGTGGISFESEDFSIAGGKVNSMLTYGKMKKNNPELFEMITGIKPINSFSCNKKRRTNNSIDDIKNLNKNYKQVKNDKGETVIFYDKKDNEKYPSNYNLKIDEDKTTISYGQNLNDYDLKLGYDLAKSNGWTGAVSDSKDLVLKSMKVSYKANPSDLFFFETKEKNTIKLDEIKDIVSNDTLSKDNLIKINDSNILDKENTIENDDYREFLGEKLEQLDYDKDYVFKRLEDGETLAEILRDEESPSIKNKKDDLDEILKDVNDIEKKQKQSTDSKPDPDTNGPDEPYRSKNRPTFRP